MGVALIALAGIALVMVVYFGIRFELGPRPVQHEVAPDSDVKFIDANGIKFGYIENGKGPLVLLFHGYPETARSWREIQARLSSEGYHVVVPFLRGYPPTSSPADGDYRGQVLGQDILALIDAFKVGTAIVVGHDWGASAAYIAATKKPEKIEKLVAISMPHPRGFEGAVKFFSLLPTSSITSCPGRAELFGAAILLIFDGSIENARRTIDHRPRASRKSNRP